MAAFENGCFCGQKDQVYMSFIKTYPKKFAILLFLFLFVPAASLLVYFVVAKNGTVGNSGDKENEGIPVKYSQFDFGGQKHPVLYNQEYVALDGTLRNLSFFKPVFSPDRAAVNPGRPRVVVEKSRTLMYFDIPGEYYLDINEDTQLKVLVLNRDDDISSNVLRVFDFLAANLVVTQGNDKEYYSDRENFSKDFFKSQAPKMLLCGPTLSFFETILRERFNLPVRDVTFTGVFMEGGQLKYSTHNVIEVFLPDKNKWMMLDVNYGFAVKWMDSFEITEKIRAASSTKKNISKAEFEGINFDFHHSVDPKRSLNASDLRSVFSPDMVTDESTRVQWHDLAKIFLGGPGYWGGSRFNHKGLPPDFQLYLSQYHQDNFLLEAQLRWQDNWDLKVRHVPPEQLKRMLNDAYAEEISAKKWLEYLPKPTQMTPASR